MKITTAWLKERGACDTGRFRKRYPRGVTLSVKNVRATRIAWDWNWLAHEVFPPARYNQFARNYGAAVNTYRQALEPLITFRFAKDDQVYPLFHSGKITLGEKNRRLEQNYTAFAKARTPLARTYHKAIKEAFIAALEAHAQEQRRARKRRRPQP